MNKEESMLQKRLVELSRLAYNRRIVIFSDFLNLNELNILHTTPKDMFLSQYKTYGGYDLSERQMAVFLPDALYYDYEYPIQIIEVTPSSKRFAENLTHRDYLGALMNLGIERSKVGDIIVYVKGLFDSNQISDDEISQVIDEAADHYGVTLSEDDKNSLVNIISKFRGIDISDDQIKGYVSDAYSTLKDMGVTKSDVKNIFEKAIEFIKGMLSRQ